VSSAFAPPLLKLDHVSVSFGGLKALLNVSISVAAGEVVAVIGPNGAGKTSLFNAITGLVPMDSGTITFRDRRIDGLPAHDIAAQGVRRTFQNGGLAPTLTVLENILAGLNGQISASPFAIALGLPGSRRAEQVAVGRSRELLGRMGLARLETELAANLSGGQQRMVEILRAIAAEAPLLLLDEPAVGLSPPMRAELGNIVREFSRSRGIGILLIEHAIELVMQISDRIVVLSNGEKIADGTPKEVRSNQTVLEAYLGHG
jgi:branched-chain amino acid transport system ATP-binding protein